MKYIIRYFAEIMLIVTLIGVAFSMHYTIADQFDKAGTSITITLIWIVVCLTISFLADRVRED